ncbi:unnamed protein product [Heterobilharzia americana]|nr:unnamed protein product [Heterobilharzia americana]
MQSFFIVSLVVCLLTIQTTFAHNHQELNGTTSQVAAWREFWQTIWKINAKISEEIRKYLAEDELGNKVANVATILAKRFYKRIE